MKLDGHVKAKMREPLYVEDQNRIDVVEWCVEMSRKGASKR